MKKPDLKLWEKPFKEVVLPSGRFAKIRKPMWLDVVAAFNTNILMQATLLAAQITLIDDELKEPSWFFEQDGPEIACLMEALNDMVQKLYTFKYGAKQ